MINTKEAAQANRILSTPNHKCGKMLEDGKYSQNLFNKAHK
jgi:hypothetical protein